MSVFSRTFSRFSTSVTVARSGETTVTISAARGRQDEDAEAAGVYSAGYKYILEAADFPTTGITAPAVNDTLTLPGRVTMSALPCSTLRYTNISASLRVGIVVRFASVIARVC